MSLDRIDEMRPTAKAHTPPVKPPNELVKDGPNIFPGLLIGLIVVVLLYWATGCATASQKCSYFPDGTLETYKLRSTVVGTGETEMVTTDCAAIGYSTKDTGLSDNGKEALGTIAEGAAKGLSPLP